MGKSGRKQPAGSFSTKLASLRESALDSWSRGRKYATKNPRNVAIGGVACVAVLGVAIVLLAGFSTPARKSGPKPRMVEVADHVQESTKVARPRRAPIPDKDALGPGRALYDAKKYEEAATAFKSVLVATDDPEARFWLGKAYLELGKDFRGCRQLRKYLENAPKGRYASSAKTALEKC